MSMDNLSLGITVFIFAIVFAFFIAVIQRDGVEISKYQLLVSQTQLKMIEDNLLIAKSLTGCQSNFTIVYPSTSTSPISSSFLSINDQFLVGDS